jgi:hypothetical protein
MVVSARLPSALTLRVQAPALLVQQQGKRLANCDFFIRFWHRGWKHQQCTSIAEPEKCELVVPLLPPSIAGVVGSDMPATVFFCSRSPSQAHDNPLSTFRRDEQHSQPKFLRQPCVRIFIFWRCILQHEFVQNCRSTWIQLFTANGSPKRRRTAKVLPRIPKSHCA